MISFYVEGVWTDVPQVGTGAMTTVVAVASDIEKHNSEMQFNVSFTQ